ncbi:MAG: MATE family efflux transporter, partial [Clostridiaceae bacterium]|nr:MATE family efflux transporter [Clostridiaceae bacterium]
MKVLDFTDRSFWKLMITFGIPIALQNLIFNSFTLVDNILIGGLGDANIAAVGVANKLSFIFGVFLFGINSGSNIFSAQFWGKKDIQGVRRVLGLSLIMGLGISLPFTFLGVIKPTFFVDLF